MNLRKIVFWLHLSAGVVAGTVIFLMSLTGALLAFERQIVTFAERHIHTVQRSSYPGPRLDLDTLMAAARAAFPDDTPSAVTLSAEPMGVVIISFGRDRNVFVDPYTGAVLGEGQERGAVSSAL